MARWLRALADLSKDRGLTPNIICVYMSIEAVYDFSSRECDTPSGLQVTRYACGTLIHMQEKHIKINLKERISKSRDVAQRSVKQCCLAFKRSRVRSPAPPNVKCPSDGFGF